MIETGEIYPHKEVDDRGIYIVLPGYENTSHAGKTYIIIILAIFILLFMTLNASQLINTAIGLASIIFGIVIILLTITLRLFKEW